MQLAKLSKIVKKFLEKGSSNAATGPSERLSSCLVCKEPNCYPSRCPMNPQRNIRCTKVGHAGHDLSTCWTISRKRSKLASRKRYKLEDSQCEEGQVTFIGVGCDAENNRRKGKDCKAVLAVKGGGGGADKKLVQKTQVGQPMQAGNLLNLQPMKNTAGAQGPKKA